MRHYLGITIGLIGIIFLALGNIIAIGEFIYNIAKTNIGLYDMLWEYVKTWLILHLIGLSLYFGGDVIKG